MDSKMQIIGLIISAIGVSIMFGAVIWFWRRDYFGNAHFFTRLIGAALLLIGAFIAAAAQKWGL